MKQQDIYEKVMYDSDESAKPATVTGWVSRNGYFFNNEQMARYDGCTHKLCNCGNDMPKMYTKCDDCRVKSAIELYNKMPFREWDGSTPLVIFQDDTYFFSEDDIEIYCEDQDLLSSDLNLVICEPNYLHELTSEEWIHDLPEDDELPDEIQKLVNILNKAIEAQGPVSWSEGQFRTSVKI